MSAWAIAGITVLFAWVCIGVGFSIAKARYYEIIELQDDMIKRRDEHIEFLMKNR